MLPVPIGGKLRPFPELMQDYTRVAAFETGIKVLASRSDLKKLDVHIRQINSQSEFLQKQLLSNIQTELSLEIPRETVISAITHTLDDNPTLEKYYFNRFCGQVGDEIPGKI